jgi:hypothetical protein
MIFFLLIALVVSVACAVIGLLVACLLFFVVAALVMLGLLSASILVGAWRKSFRKGFLFFLLAGGAAAGAVCGLVVLSAGVEIFNVDLSDWHMVLLGSMGGLAGGMHSGFVVYRLTGWAVKHFKKKLRIA